MRNKNLSRLCLLTLALVLIATTSGCANLENRLSMTLAGDAVYVNSLYGPLGITSKISDKDRDALLNIIRNRGE